MPYCLNPDCPYRKRVGKPAEFVEGIELCSDCGSPLSEDLPPSEKPEVKEAQKFFFTDWHRRGLFTLGVLFVYRILSHMPAPLLNPETFDKFMGSQGWGILVLFDFKIVTVLGLGLMPYVSAYIFVEILSLFAPRLKTWRDRGQNGRKKLRVTALVVTLLFALVEGYYIATGIESIANGIMVSYTGLGYRLISALTLTAGTFLTLWLAYMITSWGIGHGISVLIFTGFAAGFINRIYRMMEPDTINYLYFSILIFLGVIILIVMAEKTHKRQPVKYDDGSDAYVPFKVTTAGIVPAMWIFPIIALTSLILSLAGVVMGIPIFERIADALSPGKLGYNLASALILFLLYYFFTALFYNPRKIIASMKDRNGLIITPPGKNEEDYMDRSLEIMAFIGAIYLCLLTVFRDILIERRWIPIYFGGILLIKAVAIALDIFEEVRMRRKAGSLIKVAEVHDVSTAGLAKSILEGKGVSCFLRGYYHRALLYFFGPYIEISVLVPEEQVLEAQEVIGKYVGPELLVQQEGAD